MPVETRGEMEEVAVDIIQDVNPVIQHLQEEGFHCMADPHSGAYYCKSYVAHDGEALPFDLEITPRGAPSDAIMRDMMSFHGDVPGSGWAGDATAESIAGLDGDAVDYEEPVYDDE